MKRSIFVLLLLAILLLTVSCVKDNGQESLSTESVVSTQADKTTGPVHTDDNTVTTEGATTEPQDEVIELVPDPDGIEFGDFDDFQ